MKGEAAKRRGKGGASGPAGFSGRTHARPVIATPATHTASPPPPHPARVGKCVCVLCACARLVLRARKEKEAPDDAFRPLPNVSVLHERKMERVAQVAAGRRGREGSDGHARASVRASADVTDRLSEKREQGREREIVTERVRERKSESERKREREVMRDICVDREKDVDGQRVGRRESGRGAMDRNMMREGEGGGGQTEQIAPFLDEYGKREGGCSCFRGGKAAFEATPWGDRGRASDKSRSSHHSRSTALGKGR